MAKAIWQDAVLAESDHCEIVEGNHYFPPASIKTNYFTRSKTQTECPWKGTAHYYHIQVDDTVNVDAAWYYPHPKKAAIHIKDHVAFWRGVEIIE